MVCPQAVDRSKYLTIELPTTIVIVLESYGEGRGGTEQAALPRADEVCFNSLHQYQKQRMALDSSGDGGSPKTLFPLVSDQLSCRGCPLI